MLRAYSELHRSGNAHSVEVWDQEHLVGGLYGVDVDGSFSGESMFHLRPNASKLALLHLIDHLQARGLDWIDIQVLTPHMTALGAKEIDRDEFLLKLKSTRARQLKIFD
jgi:leucyl/phenylalanyl-tRNA--protein transferase